MASYRLKPRYAFGPLSRPARVPILVPDGKDKTKEIVFSGTEPVDLGRSVPDAVKDHPWLEEVKKETKAKKTEVKTS